MYKHKNPEQLDHIYATMILFRGDGSFKVESNKLLNDKSPGTFSTFIGGRLLNYTYYELKNGIPTEIVVSDTFNSCQISALHSKVDDSISFINGSTKLSIGKYLGYHKSYYEKWLGIIEYNKQIRESITSINMLNSNTDKYNDLVKYYNDRIDTYTKYRERAIIELTTR